MHQAATRGQRRAVSGHRCRRPTVRRADDLVMIGTMDAAE